MAASRYAGESPDPKKIAAEADVDLIVTGALLRAGDEVRVTTQLTDATSGTLLWSQAAQKAIGNVFQVQDELTQRIVASLSLPLTLREQKMLKRDVPASAKTYEYFLRGNQLSHDSKQWNVARDLYLRCVEEDPGYAPAWARLGRIHHVMAKYLETGTQEGLGRAEDAFQRALDLNPDLAMGHKLFAQLEVDLGRARDAMARLTKRAQSADPEVLAGLVTTSRYCGLLDASVAAHQRALGLDPRIRTSVPHTWFLQGDHERVAAGKVEENPYIVALSLGELGRQNEVVPALRELEQATKTRLREFMIAARTLLEGKEAESVAAVERIIASDFRDPEGLFYFSRHLAHLNQADPALGLLDRVVAGGFFCYPAMAQDRWLDPLRDRRAFMELMRQAETRHQEAAGTFTELRGERALGVALRH